MRARTRWKAGTEWRAQGRREADSNQHDDDNHEEGSAEDGEEGGGERVDDRADGPSAAEDAQHPEASQQPDDRDRRGGVGKRPAREEPRPTEAVGRQQGRNAPPAGGQAPPHAERALCSSSTRHRHGYAPDYLPNSYKGSHAEYCQEPRGEWTATENNAHDKSIVPVLGHKGPNYSPDFTRGEAKAAARCSRFRQPSTHQRSQRHGAFVQELYCEGQLQQAARAQEQAQLASKRHRR